jgi:hypothetical protein
VIEMQHASERSDQLAQILQGAKVSVRDVVIQRLTTDLQAEGYEVVLVDVTRENSLFLKAYPTRQPADVDAYLDVVVAAYGYRATEVGDEPWRPWVKSGVRLVRATDSSMLMQQFVYYNTIINQEKLVNLAPDPVYQYNTFDKLRADPDGAARGVRSAIEATMDGIANLLK